MPTANPLEEAKLADLVVVEQDPFGAQIDDLGSIEVALTMVDSGVVYGTGTA